MFLEISGSTEMWGLSRSIVRHGRGTREKVPRGHIPLVPYDQILLEVRPLWRCRMELDTAIRLWCHTIRFFWMFGHYGDVEWNSTAFDPDCFLTWVVACTRAPARLCHLHGPSFCSAQQEIKGLQWKSHAALFQTSQHGQCSRLRHSKAQPQWGLRPRQAPDPLGSDAQRTPEPLTPLRTTCTRTAHTTPIRTVPTARTPFRVCRRPRSLARR